MLYWYETWSSDVDGFGQGFFRSDNSTFFRELQAQFKLQLDRATVIKFIDKIKTT